MRAVHVFKCDGVRVPIDSCVLCGLNLSEAFATSGTLWCPESLLLENVVRINTTVCEWCVPDHPTIVLMEVCGT